MSATVPVPVPAANVQRKRKLTDDDDTTDCRVQMISSLLAKKQKQNRTSEDDPQCTVILTHRLNDTEILSSIDMSIYCHGSVRTETNVYTRSHTKHIESSLKTLFPELLNYSIILPKTTTTIGDEAFYECS